MTVNVYVPFVSENVMVEPEAALPLTDPFTYHVVPDSNPVSEKTTLYVAAVFGMDASGEYFQYSVGSPERCVTVRMADPVDDMDMVKFLY